MREAVSQSLFTYWNGLRRDRLAPKRFEIEPSCIAGYLPDTFILERVDPRTARFRLAGTRISEAFGAEFRGTNLFELFDELDAALLQRQIKYGIFDPRISRPAVKATVDFMLTTGQWDKGIEPSQIIDARAP